MVHRPFNPARGPTDTQLSVVLLAVLPCDTQLPPVLIQVTMLASLFPFSSSSEYSNFNVASPRFNVPVDETVYSLLTLAPPGKSVTGPFLMVIVTELSNVARVTVIVLFGLEKAYSPPPNMLNACCRVMVPRMVPGPVRVLVMMIALLPVFIQPVFIFTIAVVVVPSRLTGVVFAAFARVILANVAVPLMFEGSDPANVIVLVPAVNVPVVVQSPYTVCVKPDAAKVDPASMLRSPLTVSAPAAVLAPPPE